MLSSVQKILSVFSALLVCTSGTATRTQVSGRSLSATTSTTKPASQITTHHSNSTGRHLLIPHAILDTSAHNASDHAEHGHLFSEIELERLCPPGNKEILKSIPKETLGCLTGGLDFWYQRCRCHYVKVIPCPPCPEEVQPIGETHANSNSLGSGLSGSGPSGPAPSGHPGHGVPHFILGTPQVNTTYVYQIPLGSPAENNGSSADFATANKFAVYNSAGGIVNLYFYQTGQQQIINPALENDSNHTTHPHSTANHTGTLPTTHKPFFHSGK